MLAAPVKRQATSQSLSMGFQFMFSLIPWVGAVAIDRMCWRTDHHPFNSAPFFLLRMQADTSNTTSLTLVYHPQNLRSLPAPHSRAQCFFRSIRLRSISELMEKTRDFGGMQMLLLRACSCWRIFGMPGGAAGASLTRTRLQFPMVFFQVTLALRLLAMELP